MGRITNGADESPAAAVQRLRTEIEDARDGLGPYVSELDRRRHEALDLKLQLQRHKALGIGIGLVTAAAAAGAVTMIVRSRRGSGQMWAPWRIAPSAGSKSRNLGKFLLASVLPVALKAARVMVERGTVRRLRSA